MKIFLNAYVAQNVGDDLFMDILLKRYPKHEFYTISQFPNTYNYPNLHVYSNKLFYRLVKKFNLKKYIANKYDMVVTIGGSMFMETLQNKYDLTLGNKDRYILGVNFGPYTTKNYFNAAVSAYKKSKDVCFRDKYSYELFKDLPNVRLAPDIAFGLDKSKLNITNRKRVIVSVVDCDYKLIESRDKSFDKKINYTKVYESNIAELIYRLDGLGYEICMASMCESQGDNKAINRIIQLCNADLQNKIEKYYYKGNINEVLDLFADSSLIVGTRLHANIIGMALGKPVIPIAYSDKTIHIMEDIFENNPNQMLHIIDIRNMGDSSIDVVTQDDLTRTIDVSNLIEYSKDQFKELDKVLL